MNFDGFSFFRLLDNHEFKQFDCSNEGLNNFLLQASKGHQISLIAITYLLEDKDSTVAFYSILNDKISIEEATSKRQWRKNISDRMPEGKKYNSYPAIKIGRMGVNSNFKGQGIGSDLIDYIKILFLEKNHAGCRFITVDALKESIEFYQKNGFDFLTQNDEADDSRLMFFDLALLKI